ncbi:alpha/beta hydrolase [Umezawaea tangerina]|uniref:Alpha-beta hydrolase superfamily lysophospholipase n=1 Tax=Umezawaea tangerina TaxID=84725 RepID=A0A2T0T039_9PSEU|nr:lysophospholipase [Umezawaea tangerina]PRY39038.1 alpha-beta hydrolase superfamily lysophospholipase [Umezawaea tangerina]
MAVDKVAVWDNPEGLNPRGTVVVVPGRGEHPGVYERLGARLGADAYRVRVVGDPTLDAEGVTEQVRALRADDTLPGPHVLAGSDTGALFAAVLVATGAVAADALVLAGLPVTGPAATAADWEGELDARTNCPTHRDRLTGDGSVRRGALWSPPPSDWFGQADPAALDVPVLGVHGAEDVVSPLEAVRDWYAKVDVARLVGLAGTGHDALNNQTHRSAAATVVLFLESLRTGAEIVRDEPLR